MVVVVMEVIVELCIDILEVVMVVFVNEEYFVVLVWKSVVDLIGWF